MATSASCIPDESEEADRYWQDRVDRLMESRCYQCRHWWQCAFVHVPDGRAHLGEEAMDALVDRWGVCDVDMTLAYGPSREYARHGLDCWEER